MNIIEQYCVNNPCYREMRPLDSVQKLILHSTAVIKASGYSMNCIITANEWFQRWNKPTIQKLANFIDVDGVHLFAPLGITLWQVGEWYGNCNSIGCEMVEYTDLKKARQVYDNAVEFYAFLVKKYNLKVSDILGHKEAHDVWKHGSNHSDPDPYLNTFGKSMVTFREDVQKLLDKKEEEEKDLAEYYANKIVTKTFYHQCDEMARYVGIEKLEVRTAPDENAPVNPVWPYLSKDNMVFVIAKYDNNWVCVDIAHKTIGFVNAKFLYKK